jgi:EF-hand domain pair
MLLFLGEHNVGIYKGYQSNLRSTHGKYLCVFVVCSFRSFIRNYQGRGAVFVITGLLEIWMRSLLDLIVGFFAIYVGFLYLWSGKQAMEKMEEALRTAQASGNISLETIQEMYANADVDGKGGLSLSQWRLFIESLGMQLSKKESEAAFMLMDKNRDGRMSYDEVHRWWASGQSQK